eukprot:COSAG06_NODE_22829_length_712_cov_1.236928_2_plen_98_part_00
MAKKDRFATCETIPVTPEVLQRGLRALGTGGRTPGVRDAEVELVAWGAGRVLVAGGVVRDVVQRDDGISLRNKTPLFFQHFLVFVPSLSWQTFCFLV